VAAEVFDTFKNGTWFIELASLSDPVLVPFTIGSTLGLREEPGLALITTLMDWLKDKELLIILDNCEHLIEACAHFADEILHASRLTRILATSREALGIPGESIYRVPPLPTPNPQESIEIKQIEKYAAVRLFIDRAMQSLSTFQVTNANAPAIAQICYRLDGIPLAIELAAVRVKTLSVEKITERLDNRFLLLKGGLRTAVPRQQTLRSTTRNSMSGALLALQEVPDEERKLRADPRLVGKLVLEIIRYQSPVIHMRRTATVDTELRGRQIRAGEKVVMWYVSGNRDETAIENPDSFVIDRAKPRRHLSFGAGIHRCVGDRLAEQQLQILWEEILARDLRIEVMGPPVRVYSNFLRGIRELPVRIEA
jgi:hypothetical protein